MREPELNRRQALLESGKRAFVVGVGVLGIDGLIRNNVAVCTHQSNNSPERIPLKENDNLRQDRLYYNTTSTLSTLKDKPSILDEPFVITHAYENPATEPWTSPSMIDSHMHVHVGIHEWNIDAISLTLPDNDTVKANINKHREMLGKQNAVSVGHSLILTNALGSITLSEAQFARFGCALSHSRPDTQRVFVEDVQCQLSLHFLTKLIPGSSQLPNYPVCTIHCSRVSEHPMVMADSR